jgi:hypothetical protein
MTDVDIARDFLAGLFRSSQRLCDFLSAPVRKAPSDNALQLESPDNAREQGIE